MSVLLRESEQRALSRKLWSAYAAYQASRGLALGTGLDALAAELYAAYAEVANAATVESIRRHWRQGTDRDRYRLARVYAPQSGLARTLDSSQAIA